MAKNAQEKWEKKNRDVNIGLANNAFGATAGAVATGAAYQGAKKLYRRSQLKTSDPKHIYNMRSKRAIPKFVPKVGGKKAHWGRALKAIPGPAKAAGVIAGGGLIGMQAVNAGMDAQSAAYFAREKRDLARNKPGATITKGWEHPERVPGIGYSLTEPISKRAYFDDEREYARQRQHGRNQALMIGGAAGLVGGAPLVYRAGFKKPERKAIRTSRKAMLNRKAGRTKAGIAATMLGGGIALGGTAVANAREKRRVWL